MGKWWIHTFINFIDFQEKAHILFCVVKILMMWQYMQNKTLSLILIAGSLCEGSEFSYDEGSGGLWYWKVLCNKTRMQEWCPKSPFQAHGRSLDLLFICYCVFFCGKYKRHLQTFASFRSFQCLFQAFVAMPYFRGLNANQLCHSTVPCSFFFYEGDKFYWLVNLSERTGSFKPTREFC